MRSLPNYSKYYMSLIIYKINEFFKKVDVHFPAMKVFVEESLVFYKEF
mgnify:CR=1 FL=1